VVLVGNRGKGKGRSLGFGRVGVTRQEKELWPEVICEDGSLGLQGYLKARAARDI
jgi:hypothetical protein